MLWYRARYHIGGSRRTREWGVRSKLRIKDGAADPLESSMTKATSRNARSHEDTARKACRGSTAATAPSSANTAEKANRLARITHIAWTAANSSTPKDGGRAAEVTNPGNSATEIAFTSTANT